VLALIAIAVVWWRRARRPAKPVRVATPPAPTRPRSALDELDQLAASSEFAENRRDAYVAMAEIVRRHLGARYRFRALEATTGELLDQLAAAEREIQDDAASWFARCDAARYGDRAMPADPRETLDGARRLVISSLPPQREGRVGVGGAQDA
jgi:hypothetical protein